MSINAQSSRGDEPAALILVVGGRRFSVAIDRVRTTAETAPLTPLPWSRPPVEGLARIDGRPVVQIGGWSGAGERLPGEPSPGERLVVLMGGDGQDEIALRVDEVVGFARDGAGAAEPLPLSLVWQGLGGRARAAGSSGASDAPNPSPSPPVVVAAAQAAFEVLLLSFRGERLALGLDGVHGVATLEAVDIVTTLGGGRQRLARVEDRLLPAVVLSERLGAETVMGAWAVVGGTPGHEVALVLPEKAWFDRIPATALERIPGVPGPLAWWRSGAAEPPVGLYDFATLTGTSDGAPAPSAPLALALALDSPFAPISAPNDPAAWQRRAGTVRLMCAGLACSVPLALVGGALDPDEIPAPGTLSGRPSPGAIPVLDGRRLLAGRTGGTGGSGGPSGLWLRLRLGAPGGPGLVLVVDRLEPEPPDTDHGWLASPTLPAAPAALIEALRWDASAGAWGFRLNPALKFQILPRIAQKAVAAALIGWLPAPLSRSPPCRPETP